MDNGAADSAAIRRESTMLNVQKPRKALQENELKSIRIDVRAV